MFSKYSVIIILYFFLKGTVGFFVKHVKTGMCINDTRIIQTNRTWGNLSFVELSNNCLDPAAQFRFRDNGAMLNLKRPGCLYPIRKAASGGYSIDMFYLYVNSRGLDTEACRERPDMNTDPAITQTPWGGLSIKYTRSMTGTPPTMCIVPKTDQRLANNPGIDTYIGFTRDCNDAEDKRFNFGSLICHGNMVKNANCPKDQNIVVKTASYRGLSGTKTCGLSDDYSCEVDVTCLVKKQCDGQHECSITVDNNLFSDDPCPGLTKYLYFEYQCVTGAPAFNEPCVESVSLSSSTLPNKGFLTVSIDNEKNHVCSETLTNQTLNIVCTQLGYWKRESQSSAVASSTLSKFSGSINCGGDEKTLSQCATTDSVQDCSKQSYLTCDVCDSPLLEHKDYFPDSSFKASASQSGHHPAMARISSGSSWCAPVSNGNHYLQVDLGRDYEIEYVATFGDSISRKWVSSYRLNYTSNSGLVQWKEASTQTQAIFRGNTNAHNYAAIQRVDNIRARAVRFIPLDSVVQACMRIQICGKSIKPGKPHKLTVDQIQSTTGRISWSNPVVQSANPIDYFWISVRKGKILIFNKPFKYEQKNNSIIDKLSPFTKYNVSLKLGDESGYGKTVSIEFTTAEAAPEGPPLNVTITAESSLSLSVTWEPPEEDKRNGEIVNYIVCISHEENKPCFEEYTTKETMIVTKNLNASTKYYVRVLASTKVGPGVYSESKWKLTNRVSVTYHGNVVENTNCSKSQYMVVKTASYRGLSDTKTCGLSDGYSCEMDITCRVKKQCDGHHECNVTADNNLFSDNLCPGLTKYFYFEYQCADDAISFSESNLSFCPPGNGPRVLTNMSSGDIKAKEGDLVNLLCSAQGELPISFSWEKDQKPLDSFAVVTEEPHRSSLLVIKVKDERSFGKYICHIRDRFETTAHPIYVKKQEETNSKEYLVSVIILAILLVISFVFLVYFICKNHRGKLSNNKANLDGKNDRNNSKHFDDHPTNNEDADYEKVELNDERSTYTALKRSGEEETDDKLYMHLVKEPRDYGKQETEQGYEIPPQTEK